jgi:hypothetical protein
MAVFYRQYGESIETTTDEFEWVETYLHEWAKWMRRPSLKLGYGQTVGFVGGGTGGYRDVHKEIEDEAGWRSIQVIEAALDGCSPIERMAVSSVHLESVYQFREPVEVVYLRAREKIGQKLRKNDFY